MNKTNNKKYIINIILFSFVIIFFSIMNLITNDKEMSETERRKLQQLPELSVKTILPDKGKESFMDKFEGYASDQFIWREAFRTINSSFSRYALLKNENHMLNLKDGYISKLEFNINDESYKWSLNRINTINEKYLSDSNVYFSIIPDKNYYLGKANKIPVYDYDLLFSKFMHDIPENISFIDMRDQLDIDNYYKTDTHWKQETLIDVSNEILFAMNPAAIKNDLGDFNITNLSVDFKGVYYGQLSLPVKTDEINILKGNYIDKLNVVCLDSGKAEAIPVYDENKINGFDSYEVYVDGPKSLITIENPNANNDNKLIIFRDSFGSSIAPLFAGNYKEMVLIDVRYISPVVLSRFVDFENADVLFLYSAQVLNNSVGQFNN